MNNKTKLRNWILATSLRLAGAAVALALVLALAAVLSGAAQAQAQAQTFTYKVVHQFTGSPDGSNPYYGVVVGSEGNLYGTTFSGGANDDGTVFKVDPTGQETVFHGFTGAPDGSNPYYGVVVDSEGNLYGTTFLGGAGNWNCIYGSQCGTIFKVDPAGQETVLYEFCAQQNCTDGSSPSASLLLDAQGNLYGTTVWGGANDAGTVFKFDSAGKETVLYSFCCPGNGYPYSSLIMDSAGNLYGTTSESVFKVDAAGNETVLYTFTGVDNGDGDGANGVLRDAQGNLYGTTHYGGGRYTPSSQWKRNRIQGRRDGQ